MVHLTGDLWNRDSFTGQVYLCIESCLAFCEGDKDHHLHKSTHQLLARLNELWDEETEARRKADADIQHEIDVALEEFSTRAVKIQEMKPWYLAETSKQFADWYSLREASSHLFLETKAAAERVYKQAVKTAKADTDSRLKELLG